MSAPTDTRPPAEPPAVADRVGMSPLAAVGMSALIFLLIPIAQMLSGIPLGPQLPPAAQAIPPPEILEDIPPPPPDDPEIDQPELEESPPPPALEALDFLLNPDVSGVASADLRLPDLEPGRDQLTDLQIFDVSDLDETPSRLVAISPVYPESMRRAGIGGRVVVEFEVDRQGHTRNVRVLATPNPAFDRPTIDAIRQWRFTIGRRNGQPVEFRMRVPVSFDPDNIPD